MITTSNERVVEAVNLLIHSTNYSSLINDMTNILADWATHPMAYDGHLVRIPA